MVDEIAQFCGNWQRVELLELNVETQRPGVGGNMPEALVRVRMLDSGGTNIVPISEIFRIHTR